MSENRGRIAVLPREVASEVTTAAVSRAAWAVAIAILLMDIPIVIDMVTRRTSAQNTVVPLLAIAGLLALLAYTGLRPSRRSRIVMLAVGGVLAGVYQAGLLIPDPDLITSASYLLNRPAFVLVLVSPGITRPIIGLFWSGIGYLVAMSSMIVTDLLLGLPVITGWGPTIAVAIYSSTFVVLVGIRASQGNQIPDLGRLEDETRRLALEHQYEQRAAAVIHDTVLNDLTVVMNAAGPLDARTRDRFRTDVAALSDAAWLRESRDWVDTDPTDAALRNEMIALVTEMQWRGLTVDLTGGADDDVVRIAPQKIAAISAAVRACLENVLQHAETTAVELVLGTSAQLVTVMVIDQGVGFDPGSVPSDRLGLRNSVRQRVESQGGAVKLWSMPQRGTSVMISMPVGGSDDV